MLEYLQIGTFLQIRENLTVLYVGIIFINDI